VVYNGILDNLEKNTQTVIHCTSKSKQARILLRCKYSNSRDLPSSLNSNQ